MKLIGILPVRNEDWIIGLSLRALLMWCDELVVLNHCSTDNTADILADLERVHVITETDPVWHEMAQRQRLLEAARYHGATHVAIVDADEVLCGDLLPLIRGFAERLDPGSTMYGPMKMLHRGINEYRHDGSIWSDAVSSVLFHDAPECGWQSQNGYDHHHRQPMHSRRGGTISVPALMHLQFAHWRRLRAKHALYKVTERIRWPEKPIKKIEKMYNLALDEQDLGTHPVPPAWWAPYRDLMKYLRIDQREEQWQERETRRLVKKHGCHTFKGLNLFGVA